MFRSSVYVVILIGAYGAHVFTNTTIRTPLNCESAVQYENIIHIKNYKNLMM